MTRRAAVLALAIAAVASSCVPGRAHGILVGAVYPTEGSQGDGGRNEYLGAELAAELHNERDGSPRVRLRLESAETREEAPAAVERLARSGAQVVVGSYGSTVSRPAANAAARLGLVFWETGAVGEIGMDAGGGRSFFRVPAAGGVLGREAVAFVRDRLEIGAESRWAVTYVDDVYGRSVGIGALDEIERSGLPLVAMLPYELAGADFDEIALAVERARADVLVVAAYLADGVAIRRALLTHDVPLKANVGSSSSYCMPEFGEMLGPLAVGAFSSDKPDGGVVDDSVLSPEAAEALEWARSVWRERHGTEMPAEALSGFASALGLFRFVLPRAEPHTAEAISAAARAVDVPRGALPNGAGLRFIVDGEHEPGSNDRATNIIWQWVAERQREVVWPPEFATHDIVAPA